VSVITVVTCSACDGLTFTLRGDDVVGCVSCGQTGRRRAQLVLTVANLDTGRVASASLVPGVVEPEPWPGEGGWYLPVTPLIRELAAQVGAGSWHDLTELGRPAEGPVVFLPRQWRPELPEPERRALEARAIAAESHFPWYVYLGRTAPAADPDPDRELARLRRVADLLRLDLVVEARRGFDGHLSWDIRYEAPGGEVPVTQSRPFESLTAAMLGTGVDDALYGVAERGRTAPAHFPRDGAAVDGSDADPVEPVGGVDQLERRVIGALTDLRTGQCGAGAQGIWRNGRWWFTGLRPAAPDAGARDEPRGRSHRRRGVSLLRNWEPPAPSWFGEPIPYAVCPDCDPESGLQLCWCARTDPPAAPGCPSCGGGGWRPSGLPCYTCRDSRRIYQGACVTISDLRDRARHLAWRPGESGPAPRVATQPGGKPVHQLPEAYRIGRYAAGFGVRAEDLTEADGGGALGQDLREGVVTLDWAGADPYATLFAYAAKGQPGGRLLVAATVPQVPSAPELIRLVLGLGLEITVTLVDHCRNVGDPRLVQGESWEVLAIPSGQPPVPANPPTCHTVEAAIASCLRYIENTIAAAIPLDPEQPLALPQTPQPVEVDDPVSLIRRLARHHAGHPVAVHFDRYGCQLHLREGRQTRHLATARTLPAALSALGLSDPKWSD
jgi:hypothetical protein